jgi:hypothetical protein
VHPLFRSSGDAPSLDDVVAFLREKRHWVVSTLGEGGGPQSAVVGVAVGDGGELVFDTLGTSRKAKNLRRDARVSLAVWSGPTTAQIEGLATEPTGAALEAAQRVYFETFPDGRDRVSWPDITWVLVEPTWVRISDFDGPEPVVFDVDVSGWRRAGP